MKNLNFKLISLFILGLSLAFSSQAAETRTIHFKVIAFDQVMFDNNYTVQSCADDASSTNYTVNAWCAVSQLVAEHGWTATSSWYSYGVMLEAINQYQQTSSDFWAWFSNSEPGMTSLNQHVLSEGEKLLLAFGTSPLKLTASPASSPINSTTTLNATYFDFFSWQWLPIATSTFVINGHEVPGTNGSYQLWSTSSTPYVITAKSPSFIESEPITVTPQLPDVGIKLHIETASSTMLNQNMIVQSCEENPGEGIYTLNARCSLLQTGLLTSWSIWGSDLFLDSIGDVINNQNANGVYWIWFKDLDYGQTALNKHILSENEEILLVYGKNPLRIAASNTSPIVNSTTTVYLEQFGYDSGWNPTWQLASSSSFVVEGQELASEDGTLQLFLATTSPYSIYGKKMGYLDSPVLIITGTAQASPPPEASQTLVLGTGAVGPVLNNIPVHTDINVDAAVNFLASNQKEDGSIGSSIIYSDWSAIALAAYGNSEAKNRLKNYLAKAGYDTGAISHTTDLERRAMSFMAIGINPYEGFNYISSIAADFNNNQIGSREFFNDDIFALFPLLKAGYSGSDPIVEATAKFIILKQNDNGSWGGVDLTAAAVQALSLVLKSGGSINSISWSLQAARSFLVASQEDNGSFNNNTISTAWAVQAIKALGEDASSWVKNNKSPIDFLASRQNSDGGFEEESVALDTRIWTTAYVIPAALGKTWDEILTSFPKPVQLAQEDLSVNLSPHNATDSEESIKTSITSSTTKVSSSTEESIEEATTDVTVLPEVSTTASETKQTESRINTKPRLQIEPSKLSAQVSAIVSDKTNKTDKPTEEKAVKIMVYSSAGASALLGLYLFLKFIISVIII